MLEVTRLEWLSPEWLWLLPVPMLLFLWLRHPKSTLLVSDTTLWKYAPSSWRVQLQWLPKILYVFGLMAMVIAAASPRIGNRQTEVKKDGIAIMMVVDTSSSMRALDLSPENEEQTRLNVVQDTVQDFVLGDGVLKGRSNDMIGMVRFAGYADTTSPLTFDHLNLTTLAAGLEITTNPEEDGTAIGDALTLAVSRLDDADAKSKIILLLTDGSNTAGEESPLTAASLAKTQEIKIYAIGVGSNGRAPVRMTDPRTGRSAIQMRAVQIDDELLETISAQTDGQYFRATNNDGLQQIMREIDELERTTIQEKRYREYTEYFPHFLWLGLLCIGLSILLEKSVFRRGI